MNKTIAESLAEFSASLTFDAIPGPVVDKMKQLMLDTLGIAVSSTALPFGSAISDLALKWDGAAEATVIGSRRKVPVQNAVLCNGVLAHGQDYDDTHTESVVHPSAALVPVALAVGERFQSSGREFLTALIAGTEAAVRIALPVPNKFHVRGFHTTSVTTTFASALIAARLGGLTRQQTLDAVGICGSFLSGLVECIPAGSDAKRLHAGWAGFSGVLATQLAGAGFSGPASVFEGKLGVYQSMLRGEVPPLGNILDSLMSEWEVLNVRPKLYPCCHYLQAFLDCALAIRRDEKFKASHIKSIGCRVAPGAVNIICEPWEKKLEPATSYGARFSLPFAVSLMLAKGRAGSAEFAERSLRDPEVLALSRKVKYAVDEKYQVGNMPGWLQVELDDGRTLTKEIPVVRGDSANPILLSELQEKYAANTEILAPDLGRAISEHVLDLENASSVIELASLLASAGAESASAGTAPSISRLSRAPG